MNSLKNKDAILTGMFVVAGIAILIAGILVIGEKNKYFSKTILLKAVFDDVSGLANGNNVWYAGVKIGTVKNVAFTGNRVEAGFTIDQSVKHLIRVDTKAKLSSDGLIGNKIIVLYGGSPTAPAVTAGSILPVEQALSTEAIVNTLQDNNKNFLQITDDFKTITKGLVEGKGTFGKLLNDPSLINSLQETLQTLNKTSTNMEVFTSHLSSFSNKLNHQGTLVNDLITDTTIIASFRSTLSTLTQVSVTVNKIATNLDSTTTALNDTNGSVGLLFHDKDAASILKQTLLNLQAGTQKLDENMAALQHNFLFRGYFRKKAKNAATNKDSIATPVTLN